VYLFFSKGGEERSRRTSVHVNVLLLCPMLLLLLLLLLEVLLYQNNRLLSTPLYKPNYL
jgi:hypothetical protein